MEIYHYLLIRYRNSLAECVRGKNALVKGRYANTKAPHADRTTQGSRTGKKYAV